MKSDRACASDWAGSRSIDCCTARPHSAARGALALSVDYAKTRKVNGAPLGMLQSIQHRSADMAADYYAARSMTYDALAALDAGGRPRVEAFFCKLFVAEKAFDIADHAVQIHGKVGVVRGGEIESLFQRLRRSES